MLIDIHAHFYHTASARADWRERNASRLRAGEQVGIRWHVASILGSWGRSSPTYFPSPADVTAGNEALLALIRNHPSAIKGYACVNPNFTEHAHAEIERCLERGMIGIKLAASRRADDPLLDPIAEHAASRSVPVLQHIWQHRRQEWPGQEASDAIELSRLAARHPTVPFILAHLGGGGDWAHSLRAIPPIENVFVDLSGSGVDAGMLEAAVTSVGTDRLLFGCDLTIDTGIAKLRHLERLIGRAATERVGWKNAVGIFPAGVFGAAQ